MSIAIVGTPSFAFANSGSITTVMSPSFTAVAGNKIVVGTYCGAALGLAHVVTMSDTAGNTYTKLTNKFEATGGSSVAEEVWECDNCLAQAGNVITVVWSSVVSFPCVNVYQVSGITGSTAVTTVNSGGGTTGFSFPAAAITTPAANSIVILIIQAQDNTFTYPSGYTNGTSGADGSSYEIYSSTQTGITPTTTGTNNRTWVTIAVAYQQASGGGGAPSNDTYYRRRNQEYQ